MFSPYVSIYGKMPYIKIDPSCLASKQILEMLAAHLKKRSGGAIYVTLTQSAHKSITTILQAAQMQDASAHTMLRAVVLEYRNIFADVQNIQSKIETFFHDIESLVKFVEISSECTPNIVNIVRERFSRLATGLISEYTKHKFNFVQYYTKTGCVDMQIPRHSKLALLKHRKHIYNIDSKYIKNPKIVRDLSYRDILESPSLNFNGLSKEEITVLQSCNVSTEIIEIETGEVETKIGVESKDGNDIKLATCRTNIAVITLQHAKGLQLTELSSEITRFARNNDIDILFASQPSVDSSISFGVDEINSYVICKYIDERFHTEIASGISSYSVLHDQSMISVIGNGMVGKTGTAGRLFSHLGKQEINISTISQNASEINISFTVDGSEAQYVMNEINKICFHKSKHVSLLLFGYGNIAKGLVKMLERQQLYLESQGISIGVSLISNSKRFILNENAQNTGLCKDFEKHAVNYGKLDDILSAVESREVLNPVLVDLTSSEELAKRYPWFIERGVHIVSASKKANSLPYQQYSNIHKLCAENSVHFLYEANVGAGLPVVATIQDMLNSGDTLLKCEGVFSGTLSYIFNNYNGERPFSEIVRQAREQGFTEPDPRDDLCGADAARKLLIIARMFGFKMNYEDIAVESLVPKELEGGQYDASFFEKYKSYDGKMQKMLQEARQNGKVLRYVCSLENGKASAKVMSVPANSPLGSIRETDNIIAFITEYYNKTPIVIQGAGAGIDVTSMAVLSDIIKVFKYTQI